MLPPYHLFQTNFGFKASQLQHVYSSEWLLTVFRRLVGGEQNQSLSACIYYSLAIHVNKP